jgi:hypothetical protein
MDSQTHKRSRAMIKQRKLVMLVALVSVLTLVLAACGRNQPEPTATPEPAPVEETAPEEATEEEAAAEEATEEEAAPEEATEEEAAPEEATEEEAAPEEATEEEAVAEEATEEEAAPEEATEEEAVAEEATEEEAAPEEATEEEAVAEEATEEEAAPEEATEEATEEEAIEEEAAAEDVTAEEVIAEELSAPSGELTLVSARPLTEIVNESNPVFAAVSPDGSHIVWAQSGSKRRAPGQFCLFTFSNADKQCTDVPEEYQGYPYQLYWSPDSTQVAFTESPVALGLESDIWVFNVADGSFVNRTDDGVTGSYVQAEPGSYALDIMPMWSQADGQIYFWRVVPQGESQFQTAIYSVDGAEGDPVEVRDLSDVMAGQLPLYDISNFSMDGTSALSPDGTKIAAALSEVVNFGVSSSGLWLIDVADVEVEPQNLMTSDDYQAAYPAWQNLPGVPIGLSWTGDNAAVVLNTFSNDTHSPLMVYYNVDVTSGEITPVVDFSEVESLEALFEATEDGIPFRYYSPWTASLSPANDTVVMFNDLGGTAGVMQALLPPTGELPAVLAAADSPLSGGTARSSRSIDGKVLIYGVLLTFE